MKNEGDRVRGRQSPPAQHRFQPGRSGNPRGRPKVAPSYRSIVLKIARQRHPVRKGSKTHTVNTVELLLHLVLKQAMEGKVTAAKLMEKFRDRYIPEAAGRGGVIVVPGELSEEEFHRRIEVMARSSIPEPGRRAV